MKQSGNVVKKRRLYQGCVISNKMEKTVIVAVETTYRHEQFGKTLRRTKKYKVHDEHRVAQVGDVIEFFSGRPVSKTKYMHINRVVSGVSRAK